MLGCNRNSRARDTHDFEMPVRTDIMNGEQHTCDVCKNAPILFLHQVQLLEVPIKVVSGIVPRVTGIVDVLVGPDVRQENLAAGPNVGKRI